MKKRIGLFFVRLFSLGIFLLISFYTVFVFLPRGLLTSKIIKEIPSPNKTVVCTVYERYTWLMFDGYHASFVNLRKNGEKFILRRYKNYFSQEIIGDETGVFIIDGDSICDVKWKADNQLEVSLPHFVFQYNQEKHYISKMDKEWNGVKVSYVEDKNYPK